MAEVTSITKIKADALEASGIASAQFDEFGHLTLTRNDESTIDAGSVPVLNPTGSLVMFGGGTAPDGWLLCQGQAISRSTYVNLFNVIGTTFGAGDGSTTFNIPDMQNKMPRMDVPELGLTGGAEVHSHSVADHTHTIDNHAHTIEGGTTPAHAHMYHTQSGSPNVFSERQTGVPSWTSGQETDATSRTSTDAHTAGVKVSGVTATAALTPSTNGNDTGYTWSFPPYLNLNFIIKT